MPDDNAPLTPEQVAEGLRLDAARTPGEWTTGRTHKESEGKTWLFYSEQADLWSPEGDVGVFNVADGRENLDFACHAANHYGRALRQLQCQANELARLRWRIAADDEQFCWLADWCRERFGVENNRVIGTEGWPRTITEVAAKAADDHLATVGRERDAYAREALVALAGAHVPTPEKGYVSDGGPGQLAADIRAMAAERDRLRAALRVIQHLAEHGEPFGRYEVALAARAALEGPTP